MVCTGAPSERTTTISLSSPRERSNAIMSPEGDHTGFEALRPRSTGKSGRTYSGSIGADAPCSSAAAANATAASRTPQGARTSSLFLDLVAVAARGVAGLREVRVALELLREEVEVLAPGEARVVHHRRLAGEQVQLVVRERRVVVGVVHGFVVLVLREEARVLLGRLQRLDRLGEALRRGVAVAVRQAVAFLGVGVAQVGERDRELLVDQLLVLGQREHGLELGDGAVVVLLVIEVDVAQAPACLGIVRVLAAGGAVGLDRAVDIALLFRALADPEVVLLQHDAALAGAVFLLLAEFHHLEEVAVVLAVGEPHAVKAERDLLGRERRLADLLVIDEGSGRRRLGLELEQRVVGREHELARLAALLDAELAGVLLVAVAVQHERIAAARAQRDLRLAVGAGRALPFAVEVHVGADERVDVRANAAFRGEPHIAALALFAAFASRAPHHAVADLDFLAFPERGDIDERARVLAAPHLHAAGLAVSRHLAALGKSRRRQGELGAAADAPVAADVDAVAILLGGDHRALEREALDHVVGDVAHRAVDRARAARAPDLREDHLAARGVELGLHEVAVAVLRDAAEHDHVHGAAERRVLPALRRDAFDSELALLDLGLELLARDLAERRELEEMRRERLLGLRGDPAQVGARRVADDAVDTDADRLRGSGVKVALDADLAVERHGALPGRRDIARRRDRDHGLLAGLAAVGPGETALRVGLAGGLAVDAHGEAWQSARAAVLVGERLKRQHRLAADRDVEHLTGLEAARRAVGAVARFRDGNLRTLRRLLAVEVEHLALVVRDARVLPADADLGIRDRRAFFVHPQHDVAHGFEIGVEAHLVRLAVLRQLDEEGGLPRLDAVAGRLLGDGQLELGAGLAADLLHEQALGVGDPELLAVDHDLRLARGLAVEARPDLDVDALAAGGDEQHGGEQGGKTQLRCKHGGPFSWFLNRGFTSRAPGC